MITKDLVKQFLDELKEEETEKGMAEFIAHIFNGQFIEIYTGETFEDIALEQINTSHSAAICGRVVGAYKACLIMEVFYKISGAKEPQFGQLLFLNENFIQLFKQVDKRVTIDSCFNNSKEIIKLVIDE